MRRSFDLVVIGAGSAGCVVAARASEDPACRVLLVEAGPDPQPVPDIVADPRRQPELVRDSAYVRRYPVIRPDGSSFALLSGRIVGGGSSVNNLAAIRPMRRDFDVWSRYGGPGWSYGAFLPVFAAIESDPDFAAGPLHGNSGPMRLRRPFKLDDPADPPARALIESALALGLPRCDDMAVPEPYGICASPYNEQDGRRISSGSAYLDPVRARPNLTVLAETIATRLRLSGSTVRGVDLATPAGPVTVEASRLVLAAGVFHSPQLLMLSGIGPPAALERVGLPVRHRLDGVGENFHDHAVVFVGFERTPAFGDAYSLPKLRLVAKSDAGLDHPDLHVLFRAPARGPTGGRPVDAALPVSIHLLHHSSAGRVTLASAEPADLPQVDPALLRDPADVLALVNGIRLVQRVVEHPAAGRYFGPLATPGPETPLIRHVVSTFGSYSHGVGTCRVGPDGDMFAVVDERFRVHGLDNLWVADASVLPTAPHANTNLAAIAIGELAAREVLAGWVSPRSPEPPGGRRPVPEGRARPVPA